MCIQRQKEKLASKSLLQAYQLWVPLQIILSKERTVITSQVNKVHNGQKHRGEKITQPEYVLNSNNTGSFNQVFLLQPYIRKLISTKEIEESIYQMMSHVKK